MMTRTRCSRLALLWGAAAALCVPAPRALGAECSRASALATVVARAWNEGLREEAEFRVSAEGPYALEGFLRQHQGDVLSEALRRRLARRSFYRVHIGPVSPAGMVTYGGSHSGLVDARSCKMLGFWKGK